MKKNRFFPLILSLSMVLGGACTKQTTTTEAADSVIAADSTDIVLRVRQTSRLYTAEYKVHKIITHSDIKHLRTTVLGHEYDTQLSLGDRKVAIPIDVTLQAYIDFSYFHESQIERSPDGRHLHIILPDPKVVVISSKVNHESTKQPPSLSPCFPPWASMKRPSLSPFARNSLKRIYLSTLIN